MKRVRIALCLLLCLLIPLLASCKNSDYEQAMACIGEGDFDQAEIHLQNAGDYEDAQQLLKALPGMRLMHYLQNNGALEYINTAPKYAVTLRHLTEDAIEITYRFTHGKKGDMVFTDTTATMVLNLGETNMQVQGTYLLEQVFLGKATTFEENAEGEFDIRTYQYGDELLWDKYNYSGIDANGRALKSNDLGFLQDPSNAPLERALKAVVIMLSENNIGVTLQELGFASLDK